MNRTEQIHSFLITESARWPDCKNERIYLGGLKSCIEFKHSPRGFSNPLAINLFSEDESVGIAFEVNENWSTQFVKPVGTTPFYFSYLTSRNGDLKILDFYSWEPNYTFFRVFLYNILSFGSANMESFADPEHFKFNLPHNKKVHFYASGFEGKTGKNEVSFIPDPEKRIIRFVSISRSELKDHIFDVDHISAQFKKLTTLCDQHKFSRFLSMQPIEDQNKFYSLWRNQRAIRPDLTIDDELLMQCEKNAATLTWTAMLAIYLDLEQALNQLNNALQPLLSNPRLCFLYHYIRFYTTPGHTCEFKGKIKNTHSKLLAILSGKNRDKTISADEFPQVAYFTDEISENEIHKELQSWWNINSLPIFQSRFYGDLNRDPEAFFLLAILAIKYKLPWADLLIRRCNEFDKWPLLCLLINLNQRLCKIPLPGRGIIYLQGNIKRGNKVGITNKNLRILCSAFGKKRYITLDSIKDQLLKLDHNCQVFVSPDLNNYQIQVPPALSVLQSLPKVKLRVAERHIEIPLVWRKADLDFCGVRLRWILKKNRMQLTLRNRSMHDDCELNDEKLDFSSKSRIVRYQELSRRDPVIRLYALNADGRELHYKNRSGLKELWLYGFIIDRFGVFVEKFNCVYSGSQIIVQPEENGLVNTHISVPQRANECVIRIKGYSEHLNIPDYKRSAYEAWIRYDSLSLKGGFIIVLADVIADRLPEIRQYIIGMFNFEPIYLLHSEIQSRLECSVLISLIDGRHKFKEMRDPVLTSKPYIECGVDFLLMQSMQYQLLSELLDS